MSTRLSLRLLTIALLMVFLPQCDWAGKKVEEESPSTASATRANSDTTAMQASGPGSEVILTIDGKPRITVGRFEEYMNMVFQSQPQLQQLLALMPNGEYELYTSMKNEELLQAWVMKNNIDKKIEYQKDLQSIIDFGTRQLAVKYFQDAHPVVVTPAEVKKYYDENKQTIPELMSSRGGVNAQAAMFNTPADAQAFIAKLQEPKASFTQLAKEAKATVKDFKQVNDQSFDVEAPLREKLLSIKKFPATEVVTVGDKTWVVKATGKSEPQYIPFDQIQSRLEPFLKQQKLGEMFNKELETLKKDFNIVENKDFFERRKKVKEDEMAAMFEKEKAKQEQKPKKEEKKPQPASQVKGA